MASGKAIQNSVKLGFWVGLVWLAHPHLCAAPLRLPYSVDDNLVEDAETLNVEPEKLRLARLSLIRATEIADLVTEKAATSPMPLYSLWESIDNANFPAVLEFLFEDLRMVAVGAEREWNYEWATSFAASVLSELAESDIRRAMALAKQWPKPPIPGHSELRNRYFFDRVVFPHLQRKANQDPDEALVLVKQFAQEQEGTRPDQRIRIAIAGQFLSTGRKDETLELIRMSHHLFQASVPGEELVTDFVLSLQ